MKPPGWLLDAEPYEAQKLMFEKGSDREKFGYWAEMGLGKSAVLCADHLKQVHQDRIVGLGILVPSYLKSGWRDEWAKWRMPYPLFTWPDVPKLGDRRLREPHGVVFNYDSMIYSGGDYLEELLKSNIPYLLAADESRAIGNPNGTWTKRAMYFRTHATQLRALCGQPWTNSIMDFFPQIRWCGGLNGWNAYQFRNKFAKMGGFMGKQVVGLADGVEEEFQEIITDCGIRLLKEDWTDLPPKIWPASLEFGMTKKQQAMYDEMYENYAVSLPDTIDEEEELVYAAHAANVYQKLQQISRGYIIDNNGVAQPISPSIRANPALQLVKSMVDTVTGKLLIFCFHKHTIDDLFETLREFGCTILRGGMGDREIEEAKFQFNNNDTIKVMIAQLTVGARGHTLLGSSAQRCSTTLYYETVFDADLMWQSSDRNHRYGQDRAVVYHTLRCADIDDKIKLSLERKTNMVSAVFDAVRSKPRNR